MENAETAQFIVVFVKGTSMEPIRDLCRRFSVTIIDETEGMPSVLVEAAADLKEALMKRFAAESIVRGVMDVVKYRGT